MKHLIPQTMAAVSVLALALAVGGCGSSSDDDGMDDMVTEPTPADMQAECEGTGGRYETDGSCTSVADQIAEAAAAATAKACTDDGGRPEADGSCTSAADVMAEVAMECTAEGGRSNDDGSCTNAAGLMTEATTASAATKATAIAAEGMQGETGEPVDAGLGGTVPDGTAAVVTYTYTVERDKDGTTVEITDADLMGEDDLKFVDQMAGLGGRTMLVREMKADDDGNVVTEIVIVGTDIDEPKATPFAMVTGQMLNARDLDEDVNADDEGSAMDDWTALTVNVAGSPEENAAIFELVMSDAFAAGTGASVTHNFPRYQEDSDDVMSGDQTIEAFETIGTYNGAMGMYRCDSATSDCSATVNDKGEITGMSEGWVFTPGDGETSDVQDATYLSYGFWLKNTMDADGATTYDEVETFTRADGIVPTVDSGLRVVTGSADYKGDTVGVYVKNVTDNAGAITSATSGHFAATVDLSATFGGGGVPANDQFTIGGTITDFVLQHGEENDWAVKLGLADFSGGRDGGGEPGKSAPGNSITNAFSGVATGDSTAGAGKWNGIFHGVAGDVDHDSDPDTATVNTAPVAVIGEFNANFTDGTAAGGFGVDEE